MMKKAVVLIFISLAVSACSTSLKSLDVEKLSYNKALSDTTGSFLARTADPIDDHDDNRYLSRKLKKNKLQIFPVSISNSSRDTIFIERNNFQIFSDFEPIAYLSFAQSFDKLKKKNWKSIIPGSAGVLSFIGYRGGTQSEFKFNKNGFLLGAPLLALSGYQFHTVRKYNKNLTEILNKYDKNDYTILPDSTIYTFLLLPAAETSRITLRIKP